ncbi:MAG: hypothetical protein JW895_12905 [Thermoleophilaceae bacterium]|nr:hypothetical protein [Thermoleophilaceae bacterium]
MAPTSMWDRTEEMAKRHDQGSSTWLKLADDGDKEVVVFLGEPYPREVVFLDGKYEPFTEELRAKGHKASLRVAFNVALFESKEVKVLEQGVVFFKQLLQIRSKRKLEDWAFEIERHGAARDKNTTYSILPENKLTPEQQAEFQALPLHDLEKLYSGDEGGDDLGSYDRRSDGVVDPRTAQVIVQSLKALPRDAVDRFCQKFGVGRIKDLPAAQVEKAKVFVEALEAEFNGKGDTSEEVDPFA